MSKINWPPNYLRLEREFTAKELDRWYDVCDLPDGHQLKESVRKQVIEKRKEFNIWWNQVTNSNFNPQTES